MIRKIKLRNRRNVVTYSKNESRKMKSHPHSFLTLLYAIKSIVIRFSKHHTVEKRVPFAHAHWLGRL